MLIYQRLIPILVDFMSILVIVDWFCHHCCTSFGYVADFFGGSMQFSVFTIRYYHVVQEVVQG
jgi:hypothetical protein